MDLEGHRPPGERVVEVEHQRIAIDLMRIDTGVIAALVEPGLGPGGVLGRRQIEEGQETILDGFERAPEGLIGLFEGRNSGKMLIHVAD